MIAANNDRRRYLATRHELIERERKPGTITLPEPTNARRQSLKCNALARKLNPSTQLRILRKELEHELVRTRDIGGIAGERHPSERTLTFAKEGPHILGHEAGNPERVVDTGIERDGPNVVAVVERDGTTVLHGPHRAHVIHDRRRGPRDVLRGIGRTQRGGLGQ
jgi:hypothetical protein